MNLFGLRHAADISLYPLLPGRGGRTREGRVLYTDQTPIGDRMAIKFRHLMEALATFIQTIHKSWISSGNKKTYKNW